MFKAALRGVLCGIFTAVYLCFILMLTYFNLSGGVTSLICEFVLPIGFVVIIICCLHKERISKFLVSAIFFAAAMCVSVYAARCYNLLGHIYRFFYGYFPNSAISERQLILFAASAIAAALGLLVSFIISAVNSVRVKKLIDSLEVTK